MEYTYVSGQRVEAATDRGTWHYGYNARGEVNSGVKRIGSDVPGYSFGYEFDGIGNREEATQNGITDVYTANALNQYEQRTVPAYFQVRGQAKAIPVAPPATPLEPEGVAVKLQGPQAPYTAAAFGPANYFGLALPVPAPGNQNNSLWKGITIEAWANNATNEYKVTEMRKDFLPKSPEDYDYDADGNLTKDGRWTYQWDAENRLIKMMVRSDQFPNGSIPGDMEVGVLEFDYDWQGRRISKKVYNPEGGAVLRSNGYMYNGWALMLEIERHYTEALQGRVVTRNYSWGPDLSGEPYGAGGVAGLQKVVITDLDQNTSTSTTETWIPAYDGSGNIVSYLNAATGAITQEVEYGPFGESLRSLDTSLIRSPMGWSTKYTDEETDLVYFGYRYFSRKLGRWINRDPQEEDGCVNLMVFCFNSGLHYIDPLGLDPRLAIRGTMIQGKKTTLIYKDSLGDGDTAVGMPMNAKVDYTVFFEGGVIGMKGRASYKGSFEHQMDLNVVVNKPKKAILRYVEQAPIYPTEYDGNVAVKIDEVLGAIANSPITAASLKGRFFVETNYVSGPRTGKPNIQIKNAKQITHNGIVFNCKDVTVPVQFLGELRLAGGISVKLPKKIRDISGKDSFEVPAEGAISIHGSAKYDWKICIECKKAKK